MEAPLIRTKLQPPRSNRVLVERQALIELLNRGRDRKLTLVTAPAGYGKSTTVIEWLEQLERPFAWLSLDEADNDSARFLNYFIAAVLTQFPETCRASRQLLRSPELPDLNTWIPTLINDLLACPQSLVIVLDDFHVISDREVQQLVNALLERLPQKIHLVLVSRADPLLPLARLRAEGQMMELRVQALRFSDEEAHSFFKANLNSQVDRLAARKLNQRVEGWAVGLQMEAHTMNAPGHHDAWPAPNALQSNSFVSDYLFGEVLQQQSPALQTLLLRTSILDRFCVGLCQALLEDEEESLVDARELKRIIEDLNQANLFIIPLDEKGEWFRYHHIFQEMLQQRLTNQGSQSAVWDLHRKASGWFAAQGFTEEALHHALLAGDMETAVSIVEANSQNLLIGLERRTLERRMDSLPEEVVWRRPKLLMARAWLLYRQWRVSTLESVLDRIVECLDLEESHLDAAERQSLEAQLHTLRSATDFYLHLDYAGTIASADLAVQMLPVSEPGIRITAQLFSATAQVGLNKKEIGVRQLETVLRDPAPIGQATLQAMAGMNIVHYLSADYVQLDFYVRQFLALAEEMPLLIAPASWAAGLLSFEQNRLEDAFSHHSVMKQMRHLLNYMAGFYSWYALVRIHQIQGEYDLAQAGLDDLRVDVLRIGNRQFMEAVEALQAYQWHLEGDSARAYRWANSYQVRIEYSQLYAFDPIVLIWARILLASGSTLDWEKVETVLLDCLAALEETGFARRRTQLLAHLAAASSALDRRDTALRHLKTAVVLASPTGAIRSFVDVGDSLIPLLAQLRKDGAAADYVSELLAAFEAESAGGKRATIAAAANDPDLLTRREVEILQLMQASYSNQEIAERLVIALSTVKRHASNIYSKLGVNNRRQAVRKAEELGLLGR